MARSLGPRVLGGIRACLAGGVPLALQPGLHTLLCEDDWVEKPRVAGEVVAVSCSGVHEFSKANEFSIQLVVGVGVHGDAHAGVHVQHRSRVATDPTLPNLRQVHLIQAELFDELRGRGFEVAPGQMGENVTTSGLDLLGLPRDTRLHLGATAVVQVTGLRNPCHQLDVFQPGLMQAVLDRDQQGRLLRKAGIMAVVVAGGLVRAKDRVCVELPIQPHSGLEAV